MKNANKIKLGKILQILGVLIGLLGGYRLIKDLYIFSNIFNEGFDFGKLVFLFIFPLWVLLFEVFCVYVGIKSLKGYTPKTLRHFCVASTVVFVVFLSNTLIKITGIDENNRFGNDLIFLTFIVLGVFLYRIIGKVLTARLFPDEKFPILHKNTIGICILLGYIQCFEVISDFLPIKEGYESVPQEPWGIVSFLGCVVFFGILYKILVEVLIPKENSNTTEP